MGWQQSSQRKYFLLLAALACVLLLSACGSRRTPGPSAEGATVQPPQSSVEDQLAALERPGDVDQQTWDALTQELARQVAQTKHEYVYRPPTDERGRVSDLKVEWDEQHQSARLTWTHSMSGDYDRNGQVNAADISPLALAMHKHSGSPDWLEYEHIDGDRNGEVNSADLAPIAANLLTTAWDYRLEFGPTELGPFEAYDWWTHPDFSNDRTFKYTILTTMDSGWYRVVPVWGGTPGVPSLPAQNEVPDELRPRIRVWADNQIGVAPLQAEVYVFAESDDPDNHSIDIEWDLDGDGIFETVNNYYYYPIEIQLDEPGKLTVSARAVDSKGVASEPASVDILALSWSSIQLGEGYPSSLSVAADKPMAVWRTAGANQTLQVACSRQALPTSADDFAFSSFPTAELSPTRVRSAWIGDKPAVLFQEAIPLVHARTVRLALGRTTAPLAPINWELSDVLVVPLGANNDLPLHLMSFEGCPALLVVDRGARKIRFMWSTVERPRDPGDWRQITVGEFEFEPQTTANYAWVTELNGHPAICFANGDGLTLRYARPLTSNPLALSDWHIADIGSRDEPIVFAQIHAVNGVLHAVHQLQYGREPVYLTTSAELPAGPEEWTAYQLGYSTRGLLGNLGGSPILWDPPYVSLLVIAEDGTMKLPGHSFGSGLSGYVQALDPKGWALHSDSSELWLGVPSVPGI